jgi:hypothetical protein
LEALSLPEFWTYIRREHCEPAQVASEVLMHPETTYLSEKKHFQQWQKIKSQCRNRLQLESDVTIRSKTSHQVANKQANPSR